MLILTRRVGETIRVGDEVAITLLGVQGLQARIGITAPVSVEVHREEIYQRIQAERANSTPVHIDDRIQAAAAEPVFLTVVFKLPNAQSASPLLAQLPYGELALGTQAKVHGLTTGNLMDLEPAESSPEVDPHDLFIELNPIGASPDELEKGRSGFVDERTHGDYLIFAAGYRAAQEASACAS